MRDRGGERQPRVRTVNLLFVTATATSSYRDHCRLASVVIFLCSANKLYIITTRHQRGVRGVRILFSAQWCDQFHCRIEMSRNIFFNPIPSHSHWFIPIPIPNPMFSLVLFPFPSHSHWLFPFTAAPIPVLLVVSRSDNKWPVNSTMHTTDKSSK